MIEVSFFEGNTMPLVEIKKFDLVSNSSAIALGVKKEHKPVIQLVRKYQSDLEEFARVEFEMRPFQTKGGHKRKKSLYSMNSKPHCSSLTCAIIQSFGRLKNA